jgi:hypothetical protein
VPFLTLSSNDSRVAIDELCAALDDISAVLKRLTDQTKAEETKLDSLSLPDDTRSLVLVQAVLKHNLAPSKTTNLLKNLRDMRSEIQRCDGRLRAAFEHAWRLYTATTNGLARVATNLSILSTSTALTARIKLLDWLKDREGTWTFSRQKYATMTVSWDVIRPLPR